MGKLTDTEKVLIGEAASEGEEGMYHAASVMVNRARKHKTTTDKEANRPFQFSARMRTDLDKFVGKQPPETVEAARRAIKRANESPASDADHYMTNKLYNDKKKRPSWSNDMDVVGVVGKHTFLRSRPKKRK